MSRPHFPFSAVVGMDDLSLALCLTAVSPAIGGVLVRGEKGTAKSTIVRALASVLPPIETVKGCRFSCDPVSPDSACPDGPHDGAQDRTGRPVRLVELPLGATEDRVLGSLHLDRLVREGQVAFEPGLLAQAHRGILYVDEVNLLPDHLVDSLLDAAAMGRAQVEREAVSVSHAASFVLVGTMNPEEGELRPQLLDRFGLAVDVVADREPSRRVEVVRRRLAFEADPAAFAADYGDADAALAQRIADAREHVAKVALPDTALVTIAEICAAFDLDGLRGDIVLARTAMAHAAWSGRDVVGSDDIRAAARLALPHRRRRNPFDNADSSSSLEDILDREMPPEADPEPDPPQDPPEGPPQGPGSGNDQHDATFADPEQGTGSESTGSDSPPDVVPPDQEEPDQKARTSAGRGTTGQAAADPYAARLLQVQRTGRGVTGRRSVAATAVGRAVRDLGLQDPRGHGLSVMGTVTTAARRTASSSPLHDGDAGGLASGGRLHLTDADLRRSLRLGREGNLVVFAVDTSGSMGAARRIREVKTAVVSLLLDAYQRRDRVAVVVFNGSSARVVLPPTSSVDRAERLLADVPTGGRTPLAEGITMARELVAREQAREPQRRPLVLLLTDGRASSGPEALRRALATAERSRLTDGEWVVLDCENPRSVRLGLARRVAGALGAECFDLGDVAAARLAQTVRSHESPKKVA